jgi:small subunit ribosomal protein S18
MPRKNHAPGKPKRRAPERLRRGQTKPKVCVVCTQHDGKVDYKDLSLLRRFISDRAKIRGARVTGNCPQCQRKVAQAIKSAREMALLPYLGK